MDVVLASVMEQSNKLLEQIAVIYQALLDIITLTSSSQSDGKPTDSTVQASSTPVKGKGHPGRNSSPMSDKRSSVLSSKSTPQHDQTSSSRMLGECIRHTSNNIMGHVATLTQKLTTLALNHLSSVGEEVLSHFCKLVSEAAVKAVLQSHSEFTSSLHAADKTVKAAKAHYSPAVTRAGSREKSVTFNIPDVHMDEEGEQIPSTSPKLSVADTKSTPPLQLTVDVYFSTPRIQLEPTLDNVHSDLLEISAALLYVLHHMKWWVRPNTGRTLYDVFEISADEDAMHNNILKSIQSKD